MFLALLKFSCSLDILLQQISNTWKTDFTTKSKYVWIYAHIHSMCSTKTTILNFQTKVSFYILTLFEKTTKISWHTLCELLTNPTGRGKMTKKNPQCWLLLSNSPKFVFFLKKNHEIVLYSFNQKKGLKY